MANQTEESKQRHLKRAEEKRERKRLKRLRDTPPPQGEGE
jgi:hypothetical protein